MSPDRIQNLGFPRIDSRARSPTLGLMNDEQGPEGKEHVEQNETSGDPKKKRDMEHAFRQVYGAPDLEERNEGPTLASPTPAPLLSTERQTDLEAQRDGWEGHDRGPDEFFPVPDPDYVADQFLVSVEGQHRWCSIDQLDSRTLHGERFLIRGADGRLRVFVVLGGAEAFGTVVKRHTVGEIVSSQPVVWKDKQLWRDTEGFAVDHVHGLIELIPEPGPNDPQPLYLVYVGGGAPFQQYAYMTKQNIASTPRDGVIVHMRTGTSVIPVVVLGGSRPHEEVAREYFAGEVLSVRSVAWRGRRLWCKPNEDDTTKVPVTDHAETETVFMVREPGGYRRNDAPDFFKHSRGWAAFFGDNRKVTKVVVLGGEKGPAMNLFERWNVNQTFGGPLLHGPWAQGYVAPVVPDPDQHPVYNYVYNAKRVEYDLKTNDDLRRDPGTYNGMTGSRVRVLNYGCQYTVVIFGGERPYEDVVKDLFSVHATVLHAQPVVWRDNQLWFTPKDSLADPSVEEVKQLLSYMQSTKRSALIKGEQDNVVAEPLPVAVPNTRSAILPDGPLPEPEDVKVPKVAVQTDDHEEVLTYDLVNDSYVLCSPVDMPEFYEGQKAWQLCHEDGGLFLVLDDRVTHLERWFSERFGRSKLHRTTLVCWRSELGRWIDWPTYRDFLDVQRAQLAKDEDGSLPLTSQDLPPVESSSPKVWVVMWLASDYDELTQLIAVCSSKETAERVRERAIDQHARQILDIYSESAVRRADACLTVWCYDVVSNAETFDINLPRGV